MSSAQRRVSSSKPKPAQRGTPDPAPKRKPSTQTSQTPASDEQRGRTAIPIGSIMTYEQMMAQRQPTYFPPAPSPFEWTTQRTLQMMYIMTSNEKPTGVNKFTNISFIRLELNIRLKLNVPIIVVFEFITSRWDLDGADNIEYNRTPRRSYANTKDDQVTVEAQSRPRFNGPLRTPKIILERIDSQLNKRQMEQLLKAKVEKAAQTAAASNYLKKRPTAKTPEFPVAQSTPGS
ncbi:hypothetical protein ACI65C_006360 [Semiaphis heraclei]